MTTYYGDFPEDASVYIPFNTFDSNDPAASVTITNLADADIKVHKDGSVTQIVTDGATVAIDYDGITGNHLITVDTSAHADYSTGSDYAVRIEGTTVDAGTINAWVGSFSIENRVVASVTGAVASVTGAVGSVTAQVSADMTAISGDATAADNCEAAFDGTGYAAFFNAMPQILLATTVATVTSQTEFILTAGSSDDDSYPVNGTVVFQDANVARVVWQAATATYTGSTTTITTTATAGFVVEVGDPVYIFAGGVPLSQQAIADALAKASAASVEADSVYDYLDDIRDLKLGTIVDLGSGTTVGDNLSDIAGSGFVNTTDALEDLQAGIAAIPTTAMRGTDNAATATALATAQTDLDTITGADGANLLSATQASIDAIEADTNELQGDWTNGGRLDLLLDRLITELDTATAEPGQGSPAATAKRGLKIDYLYKQWRNKVEQTATAMKLYDDAGTTVDQKTADSDDGTTATHGEVVTGP